MAMPDKPRRSKSRNVSGQSGSKGDSRKEKSSSFDLYPLKGKVFYLDLRQYGKIKILEKDLIDLGGVVEKFLCNEVTHVISNRIGDASGDGAAVSSPNPSPVISNPSPMNLKSSSVKGLDSPQMVDSPASNDGTKTASFARGKAIAQKAVTTQRMGNTDVLTNAKKWGAKIKPLEQVVRFITNYKERLSRSNTKTKSKPPKTASQAKPSQKVSMHKMKRPYLKVEHTSRHFRPLSKEFSKWPTVGLDTVPGACPFDGVNYEDGHCAERSEDRGNKEDETTKQSECTISKTNQKVVRLVTAGEARQAQEKQKRKKNAGYCECCQVHYEDLLEHLRSDTHTAFVNQTKHYTSLDAMVSEGPNMERFLNDVLKYHNESKNYLDNIRDFEEDELKISAEGKKKKTINTRVPATLRQEDPSAQYSPVTKNQSRLDGKQIIETPKVKGLTTVAKKLPCSASKVKGKATKALTTKHQQSTPKLIRTPSASSKKEQKSTPKSKGTSMAKKTIKVNKEPTVGNLIICALNVPKGNRKTVVGKPESLTKDFKSCGGEIVEISHVQNETCAISESRISCNEKKSVCGEKRKVSSLTKIKTTNNAKTTVDEDILTLTPKRSKSETNGHGKRLENKFECKGQNNIADVLGHSSPTVETNQLEVGKSLEKTPVKTDSARLASMRTPEKVQSPAIRRIQSYAGTPPRQPSISRIYSSDLSIEDFAGFTNSDIERTRKHLEELKTMMSAFDVVVFPSEPDPIDEGDSDVFVNDSADMNIEIASFRSGASEWEKSLSGFLEKQVSNASLKILTDEDSMKVSSVDHQVKKPEKQHKSDCFAVPQKITRRKIVSRQESLSSAPSKTLEWSSEEHSVFDKFSESPCLAKRPFSVSSSFMSSIREKRQQLLESQKSHESAIEQMKKDKQIENQKTSPTQNHSTAIRSLVKNSQGRCVVNTDHKSNCTNNTNNFLHSNQNDSTALNSSSQFSPPSSPVFKAGVKNANQLQSDSPVFKKGKHNKEDYAALIDSPTRTMRKRPSESPIWQRTKVFVSTPKKRKGGKKRNQLIANENSPSQADVPEPDDSESEVDFPLVKNSSPWKSEEDRCNYGKPFQNLRNTPQRPSPLQLKTDDNALNSQLPRTCVRQIFSKDQHMNRNCFKSPMSKTNRLPPSPSTPSRRTYSPRTPKIYRELLARASTSAPPSFPQHPRSPTFLHSSGQRFTISKRPHYSTEILYPSWFRGTGRRRTRSMSIPTPISRLRTSPRGATARRRLESARQWDEYSFKDNDSVRTLPVF